VRIRRTRNHPPVTFTEAEPLHLSSQHATLTNKKRQDSGSLEASCRFLKYLRIKRYYRLSETFNFPRRNISLTSHLSLSRFMLIVRLTPIGHIARGNTPNRVLRDLDSIYYLGDSSIGLYFIIHFHTWPVPPTSSLPSLLPPSFASLFCP
jgi:hypothetical protein